MRKKFRKETALDDYVECFGDFSIKDPICKKYCSLCLRCAVENSQKTQLEILEDLVSYEELFLKIQ
ncbi:MAG: hypothetical protein Q8P24_02415 [Desulfobacterales bacterium]|nr:hypothetical protein [Desulfobacterales bacterium]